MIFRVVLLLLIVYQISICSGSEMSDAFIVKVYDQKVKVLSAAKYYPKINVIIENRTLNKVLGRVECDFNNVIKFVFIPSRKSESVEVDLKNCKKLYFIPMSPSFQKVELAIGKKSYEIPPQR